MMRLLDTLFHSVWRPEIVGILDAVIDALKVLVHWQRRDNWLVHYLIVGFEVHGRDSSASPKQMLKYIVACDSKESSVLDIQLLEVRVFYRVNDLIIECLVHCSYILVDSSPFVMLKLGLVSVV